MERGWEAMKGVVLVLAYFHVALQLLFSDAPEMFSKTTWEDLEHADKGSQVDGP